MRFILVCALCFGLQAFAADDQVFGPSVATDITDGYGNLVEVDESEWVTIPASTVETECGNPTLSELTYRAVTQATETFDAFSYLSDSVYFLSGKRMGETFKQDGVEISVFARSAMSAKMLDYVRQVVGDDCAEFVRKYPHFAAFADMESRAKANPVSGGGAQYDSVDLVVEVINPTNADVTFDQVIAYQALYGRLIEDAVNVTAPPGNTRFVVRHEYKREAKKDWYVEAMNKAFKSYYGEDMVPQTILDEGNPGTIGYLYQLRVGPETLTTYSCSPCSVERSVQEGMTHRFTVTYGDDYGRTYEQTFDGKGNVETSTVNTSKFVPPPAVIRQASYCVNGACYR